jgi:hypothetical protein
MEHDSSPVRSRFEESANWLGDGDPMLGTLARLTAAALLLTAAASQSIGQGTPSPRPGPTNPTSPPATNPQAQPGATIVINPTIEECRRGWNSTLKWTKDQFDRFCTALQSSK